ncbi:MAG: GntR family transcriptional regulator [Candidatus Omnitrophota bacterium]
MKLETITRNNGEKKYETVFKDIYEKIRNGTVKEGDTLEPENILAKKYNVSRITFRRALGELSKLGLIYAVPGKGTFIGNRTEGEKKEERPVNILVITEYATENDPQKSWIFQINRIIDKTISKNGGRVYVFNYLYQKRNAIKFEEIYSLIKIHNINGIILVCLGDNFSYFVGDTLRKLSLPIVKIGGCEFPDPINYVTVDGRYGAFCATEHLIKLGHSKIAFIFYSDEVRFSHERLEGYKDALRMGNIGYKETNIIKVDGVNHENQDSMFQEGYLALKKKTTKSNFTAVVAINDAVAAGIIKYVKETGRRVPENFSVVGFDDSPMYRDLNLTTMQFPIEEMGEVAADFLINKILNGQTKNISEVIKVNPILITRNTSGHPNLTGEY